MNKPKQKKNNYNPDILNELVKQFGFSIDYIRKCLRKDREGIMPDKVIALYKKLDTTSKKAIKEDLKSKSN